MKNNRFYTLQWTWGIIMNIIGFIAYEFLSKILKYKTEDYYGAKCVIFPGKTSFGLSLGMYILRGTNGESIMPHEFGHSIQNAIFGPFFIILVAIPSALRYWYRNIKQAKGQKLETDYYDIWFEKQASEWGEFAINNLNNF